MRPILTWYESVVGDRARCAPTRSASARAVCLPFPLPASVRSPQHLRLQLPAGSGFCRGCGPAGISGIGSGGVGHKGRWTITPSLAVSQRPFRMFGRDPTTSPQAGDVPRRGPRHLDDCRRAGLLMGVPYKTQGARASGILPTVMYSSSSATVLRNSANPSSYQAG